jgi:hypothetical protein
MNNVRIKYHQNVMIEIIMDLNCYEQKNLYRLLNFMSDVNSNGFWVGLREKTIYAVSVSCYHFLGLNPDDLIGKYLFDIISEDDIAHVELDLEYVNRGIPRLTQCIWLDVDEQKINMVWFLVPTKNHGIISYVSPAPKSGEFLYRIARDGV